MQTDCLEVRMFGIFRKKQASQSYIYDNYAARWSARDYVKFADEAYVKNVIANHAIKMVSTTASTVSLKFFRLVRGQKRPIAEHVAISLLRRPNPMQSLQEFMEAIYSYRQISGSAFVLSTLDRDSNICELYTLRPDQVKVIASDSIIPLCYQHKVGKNLTEYPVDQLSGFSRILHLKNFNPLDELGGLSSIESAAYSIDQHNQAGQWNQALLQNGARPSGAIIVNKDQGSLTTSQYRELKEQIDSVYSGAANAGRPMLLEGGLDWKEMSLSPREMDFIAMKHSSARDIALAIGVPPQLLGIPGDNTYSNFQEARVAFWEHTIIPLINNTISNLNRWLNNFIQEEIVIEPDLDSITALSQQRDYIWERVQNATFMTINEKRNALGLPAIEGGDSL